MRILSKFYDFYDIALGLGYDSHVDYIRTPREVIFKDGASPEKEFFSKIRLRTYDHSYVLRLEYIIIGFCGQFYPLIIATKNYQEKIYCYSLEELSSIIDTSSRWSGYKNFYENVRALKNDDLFIANHSPIVIVDGAKATWNAFLKPYGFMRIIDPYQAFQKIEMFLGNMAAPEKPIPKQSDIEKVKSHGFDPKMGFRKGKS